MTTFNKIINKVVNLDNNIFSLNYDKSDNISGIYKFFFSIMHNNNVYKNKFDYIKKTMNNFYFATNQHEKNNLFDLFCRIQSIYHKLNRFVYLYKYKKSKLIVDTDLQLNKINANEPNVICIYHIDSKYLFKIEELIKLIYMALTNNVSFFSEPISIKNPYNNIPFGKSILYCIYIYLVSNTKIRVIKPDHLDIFLKFKESNFNMSIFINNYEYILREYGIKNYLNNSTKQNTLEIVNYIIYAFNANVSEMNKIEIAEEFPQDVLIRIMKPYLYLYLVACYSLVEKNKNDAENLLVKKLCEFQSYNPQFGRKIIKFKDIVKNGKKRIKSHIEFNMKHKQFNVYDIESFMNNHLSYKDEMNDEEEEEEYYETDSIS